MAEALTGLLDHMRELLDGTQQPRRPIPTKRLRHSDEPLEDLLPIAAAAPYPFFIRQRGWRPAPQERPHDVSGDYRWREADILVTVAYEAAPHDHETRQDTIIADEYAIFRTLTDPRSWVGETGFHDCTLSSSDVRDAREGDIVKMHLLEVALTLIYREDHST